ncbi:MAG: Coenzyme F420 hydrogenase/dehydrogenase, beta subunit C-terminal domain [Lachnospiraceae bacterium]|jgi:coenzyme F420-reducing hydrogenase beta subunit|nr:hypothetical protein C804_04459 [Lachnospiraceae bacterium A4]
MDKKTQNIDRTTEDGLCTSCGVCAAVCPVSCIRFERQEETYLPVIDYDKCIRCGKCLRVCPGYSYTYSAVTERKPVCFSVQAKEKKLLKHASSGGLVTAMVQKLLRDGQYHTAFLVRDYDYENQLETQSVRDGEILQRTQQSRYLPVSQEKAVRFILGNPDEKVIFVGTGCAVHGLCNALKEAGRSRENILVLGLFCDQTMTYSIYEYLKRLKRWNSPVKALHFRDKRAGGWPGNIRMEFQNGTHVHLPANERMMVKEFCRQKRCLYCMDKLNAAADLSVGDNYTKKDDSAEGSSSLIIRTASGQRAWEYCQEEFFVSQAQYLDIADSQHLEKKLENQWRNNLVFAQAQNGRQVEYGVPCDLLPYGAAADKAGNRDKARLKKQLRKLRLGENRSYGRIRWYHTVKRARMDLGRLLIVLHLRKKS